VQRHCEKRHERQCEDGGSIRLIRLPAQCLPPDRVE
jgi:hypothetical protein